MKTHDQLVSSSLTIDSVYSHNNVYSTWGTTLAIQGRRGAAVGYEMTCACVFRECRETRSLFDNKSLSVS